LVNNYDKTFGMKKNGFWLLMLMGWAGVATAQDLNFSQFYELPLLRNPALAGIFSGDVRAQAVHRSQWQSVTVPFQTTGGSVEVKFPIGNYYDFLTIGAQITHDVAGDSKLRRTQFLPAVNFHKSLNDNEDMYLSGAFMGGLVSSQFDPTGLKWDDQFVGGQYSPTNPTSQVLRNTGRNYFDMTLGLSFTAPIGYGGKYYLGAALYHLNQPAVAFDATADTKLAHKYIFNAGVNFMMNDYDKLTMYADYFMQGGARQLMMGVFYTHDLIQYDEDESVALTLGGIYRWNDALAPIVQLNYKKWTAGLSYDINVSKLTTASAARGGFEFTVGFRNFINSRIISSYKMKCVGF
jgi:type IX secretion system PorP/SprF family membrane protein